MVAETERDAATPFGSCRPPGDSRAARERARVALVPGLVTLLGDPGACPHGNPIPGSVNAVDPGPLQPLSTVQPGHSCVVRRIDEHLQTQIDHMRELEAARLLPGQEGVIAPSPNGDLELRVDGVAVTLQRGVAANVYVTV